jgi:hypothetical protein
MNTFMVYYKNICRIEVVTINTCKNNSVDYKCVINLHVDIYNL